MPKDAPPGDPLEGELPPSRSHRFLVVRRAGVFRGSGWLYNVAFAVLFDCPVIRNAPAGHDKYRKVEDLIGGGSGFVVLAVDKHDSADQVSFRTYVPVRDAISLISGLQMIFYVL
jgi:hypothetical protein